MNEAARKWLMIGGAIFALLSGMLSGWNGYAVSKTVEVNGAPPSLGQVAGVALPGAAATAGGVAALVAWLLGSKSIGRDEIDAIIGRSMADVDFAAYLKNAPKINVGAIDPKASTREILDALAVLISSRVGEQAKALLAALAANRFPPYGRIEIQWPDKPPQVLTWGTPSAVEPTKARASTIEEAHRGGVK